MELRFMNKDLVIVFVKNIVLGKVKTRLAKSIGNEAAFEVYKELVKITEIATQNLEASLHIYFSDTVNTNKWEKHYKTVQEGKDLGERMKNAFNKGFENGYNRIVLIGSDLPDITTAHIQNGLNALDQSEVVFGPAEDGGYYLIGMSKMHTQVFENKPWSENNLLDVTTSDLRKSNVTFTLLKTLNDIDTYEDLIQSNFYKNHNVIQQKIKQLHD